MKKFDSVRILENAGAFVVGTLCVSMSLAAVTIALSAALKVI